MKNQILITLLVGGTAGLGGALLGHLVTAPTGPKDGGRLVSPTGAEQTHVPGNEGLDARLNELAMTTSDLTARLAALEAGGGARRAEVQPEGGAPVELDDDLASLAASLRTGQASGDFEFLVESVLSSIAERELREKEIERDQLLQDQIEQRLDDLTERLGLSAYQVKELRPVLFDSEKKRQELFTAARESGDFRSTRDSFREQRDATMEVLGTILSPEQLEEYQSSDRGFGRGGFGGGGDRRGGNTGGGNTGGGGGQGGNGRRGG